MMESPKICSICREPYLSNFSTIFQKETANVNEISRQKMMILQWHLECMFKLVAERTT